MTRTFTLTVEIPKDRVPGYIQGIGKYNETAFRSLDILLALCHNYNVRLILPFIDSHSFGNVRGMDEFAAFRGKPGELFFTARSCKRITTT